MVESGCSSGCYASCAGPVAEITAGSSIAAVKACDSANVCTRQEFGPRSELVESHSFSLQVPEGGSTTTLTLRGYGFDGAVIASGTVESSFGDSDCCMGRARFTIYPNIVRAEEQ
ncbi:MAG: hypothetical protein QNL59_00160 [Actinomycetota bacterium]